MNRCVLLAGNWKWDIYEEALARGFRGLGWDVARFCTLDAMASPDLTSLSRRLLLPWSIREVNQSLLRTTRNANPRIIFLWRCGEVVPDTVRALRRCAPLATIVAYHNDCPYHGFKNRIKNRHFLHSLQYVDIVAVYRPGDLDQAFRWGARRAKVLMPSFIRHLHRPVPSDPTCDVIYVGHYEPDGRLQILDALHRAGISVRVHGTQWKAVARPPKWLKVESVHQVWGEAYVRALSSAKIALAFLSKRHRDVYTRRVFEIPACGSLLCAPRTSELEALFHDGHEAVFWDSTADLIAKIKYLLRHEDERARIAEAGRNRVLRDGHDEFARAREVLSWLRPKAL